MAAITGAARGLAEAGSTWAAAADGHTVALPPTVATSLVRAFVRVPAARDELMVPIAATATRDTLTAVEAEIARGAADATTARNLATLHRIVRRSLAR